MKRPWFFWGLIIYICSFAKILGMSYVFIPILLLLIIYFPKRKWLILLIILRLLIPDANPELVEGQASLRKLSPLKRDLIVQLAGDKYLLRYQDLEEGIYRSSFEVRDFSKKRSPLGFCEDDYYRSLGLKGYAINWQGQLLEPKASVLNQIREGLYNRGKAFGDYQGLAYSLVFGLKEGLEPQDKDLFQRMGLMHLFVVSGLHLGIYYRGILGLVSLAKLPRIVGEGLGLLVLAFFVFLSDFHVSSLRTFLIIALEILAFHKKKKLDSIEALGLVAMILLIYRPSYAASFSFILGTISYGVLRITNKNSMLKMYLIMLPLQMLFLAEIKLLYYLANGLVAGLMSYLLPLLMLGFVFKPLAWVSSNIFISLMEFLKRLERTPWAWRPGSLGWFSMMVFYLFIFILPLMREDKHTYRLAKNKKFLLACLVFWLVITGYENNYRSQGLHFLDVGQGDSSLIVTEDKRTILIDTGRGRAIHEHLQSLGISKLDTVFISHFDEDHSKELDNLSYDKLYYPKGSDYPTGYPLEKGDIITYPGIRIEILSPDKPTGDDNEDSLVMLVEFQGRRLLYTGDIGIRTLKSLERPRVDILKYPHHGSRHSLDRAYYDALDPQLVILSYGENNSYGHPHEEVMDYLEGNFEYFGTGSSGSFQLKPRGFRAY